VLSSETKAEMEIRYSGTRVDVSRSRSAQVDLDPQVQDPRERILVRGVEAAAALRKT